MNQYTNQIENKAKIAQRQISRQGSFPKIDFSQKQLQDSSFSGKSIDKILNSERDQQLIYDQQKIFKEDNCSNKSDSRNEERESDHQLERVISRRTKFLSQFRKQIQISENSSDGPKSESKSASRSDLSISGYEDSKQMEVAMKNSQKMDDDKIQFDNANKQFKENDEYLEPSDNMSQMIHFEKQSINKQRNNQDVLDSQFDFNEQIQASEIKENPDLKVFRIPKKSQPQIKVIPIDQTSSNTQSIDQFEMRIALQDDIDGIQPSIGNLQLEKNTNG